MKVVENSASSISCVHSSDERWIEFYQLVENVALLRDRDDSGELTQGFLQEIFSTHGVAQLVGF